MEIIEALEKYTVVQLIFAFLVLLPTWGIVHEVRLFRTGGKGTSADVDTTTILAETLGGIIANELRKVADSVRDDQQTNTQDHQGIVNALNRQGAIMERIATLIGDDNKKTEDTFTAVEMVSDNLTETNKVVEVMGTDIETIKSDLEAVKKSVKNMEEKGLSLDAESRATMQQFIEAAEKLEKQLSKVTQETPATSKPKSKTEKETTE
ncbi:MAG TPA: hypothetical protein ENI05_03155 [Porticoccus sp.]|nr:hypothetical protein [Porticoccus sp.]